MNTLPAVLLAAAGVGVGHAIMPDHWLPLAVLSRTRRYRTVRVARLALAAALAHVVVSVVLGAILIVVGLQFRATIARHADLFVGGILLATGAVVLVLELLGKGHGHHRQAHHDGDGNGGRSHSGHDGDDGHGHWHHRGHGGHDRQGRADNGHVHHPGSTAVLEHPEPGPQKRAARGLASLFIPFGAAASPDLTILPVFLAASALGTTAAVGCLAAFSLATAATIVGLTTATAVGAGLFTAPSIDRRASLVTGLTLIAIGALVGCGVI